MASALVLPQLAANGRLRYNLRSRNRLLELPSELRIRIWRYALEDSIVTRNEPIDGSQWTLSEHSRFVLTCKLIYNEAVTFIPESTTVDLGWMDRREDVVLKWSREYTHRIQVPPYGSLFSWCASFSKLRAIVVCGWVQYLPLKVLSRCKGRIPAACLLDQVEEYAVLRGYRRQAKDFAEARPQVRVFFEVVIDVTGTRRGFMVSPETCHIRCRLI